MANLNFICIPNNVLIRRFGGCCVPISCLEGWHVCSLEKDAGIVLATSLLVFAVRGYTLAIKEP